MEKKGTFYITTPIYYPSGNMHIGHTYTTVAADTMTRFKKQLGYDAYFLTGTDEHGQKIERKAAQAGKTPKEFVDEIVAATKDLWKLMNIEYDDFIRTTDERHVKAVQKIFKQFYEQGDIYKSSYEGQYCAECESFWTPTQLKEGNLCPDCGRPTETAREESYFFRMSKYQDWLIDYIETHPDFIQPPSRANEMLNNFLRPGLQDLCVSRTSFKWGIPVDFDPGHVVYVWVDALSNYITALGYGSDDDHLFQEVLAGGRASGGQGDRALPHHLLADHAPRAGAAAAQAGVRPRLAAVRQRQDVQIQGQRGLPRPHRRALRRGRAALLPDARNALRRGRQLHQRGHAHPHQRRSGQRPGQPFEPHGGDDREVLRRRSARPRRGGGGGQGPARAL